MTVSLAANALVTEQEAREFLWTDNAEASHDASELDNMRRLINMVSDAIEKWTGRYFINHGDIVEYHDGGHEEIYLRHYPVVGTPAVEENGSALDASNWDLYPDMGLLARKSGVWYTGRHKVKVSYTAGYGADTTAIPDDVRLACLIWLKATYQATAENFATVMAAGVVVRPEGMPAQVKQLLDSYRVVAIR